MLTKKNLIVMSMLSFLTHMAVAGALIYIPPQLSKDDLVEHPDRIVWGIVQGQGAGVTPTLSLPRHSIRGGGNKGGRRGDGTRVIRQKGESRIKHIVDNSQESAPPLPSPDTLSEGKGEGSRAVYLEAEDGSERPSGLPFQQGEQDQEIVYSDQVPIQSGGNAKCNNSSTCGEGGGSGGYPGIDRFGTGSGGRSSDSLRVFLEQIRGEIERHKYYPAVARVNGIEGTVYINFHIGRDGRHGSIAIGRSSGFKILDESAMRTLKSIKQFSPVPEEIRELDITVPVAYRLTDSK